jgi:hypothetical protein
MTPVPAEVFEKQASLREMFRRISDVPHAAIARHNLAQAARDSSAVHAAEHATAQAADVAKKTHAAHDPLHAARAAAKAEYAKKLPGAVSAKDARKAFDASQREIGATAEKLASLTSPEAILAARAAANAAHAKHLGTAMPTPEWLRSTYGHTTPESFRAQYGKSLEATGIQAGKHSSTPAMKGVESYIHTGHDGAARVSDAGLGYLHADQLRAESAALSPKMDTRSHERFALHGGLQGMMNHVQNLDIHGRPATNEVTDSAAALAKMKPRNAQTGALWQRIQATEGKGPSGPARKRLDAVRAPAPTQTQGNAPTAVDQHAATFQARG